MLRLDQMVRDIMIVDMITIFKNVLRALLVAGSPSNRPYENGLSACLSYMMVEEENGVLRLTLTVLQRGKGLLRTRS